MNYVAVVEMQKGETRRIHMSHNLGEGFIDLGLIKDKITVNNGVMPVHYGYIENTLNKLEGDSVDALILSKKDFKTGDKVDVNIIGMYIREDGDNKVIVCDETLGINSYEEIPAEEQNMLENFFSFTSPIISIVDKTSAEKYLSENLQII